MKKIIIISIILVILATGGYFAEKYLVSNKPVACTTEAKICPDGSSVGRTGPNCEFSQCPSPSADWRNYTNNEYGFKMTFPDSWKGFTIIKQTWQGEDISVDASVAKRYSGDLIVIKNPQTTATQQYQDIPIMVFTPDVWQLIMKEKVSVSAAPFPPAEVGQNAKYVFATPPRWYGFTDATGTQEAVNIVKTFKGF